MSTDDLDAARAELEDLERRLAAGEPVGREERRAVNARYTAASDAHEAAEADARRTPDAGPDQTIGG